MVVLNSFRAIYCFACISCKALIPRCMTVLAAWHVTCCQQFFLSTAAKLWRACAHDHLPMFGMACEFAVFAQS